MQQVQQYVSGERDYTKIYGGTGPLVYPAAHVYVYNALYRITEEGRDILLAQIIFGMVYLVTLGVVMLCYRQAKVCATFTVDISGMMGSLTNFCALLGASVYISYAHIVKETAQHISTPLFQRLLCGTLPLDRHICIPTAPFHNRELSI